MTTPGAVLCGGASRRMGRDKALVEVDGVPLAARVARALAAGGCHPVVLVGDLPALHALGWEVVPDAPGAHRHPLRGVAAALARWPAADGVLVAACDLVSLAAVDVAALLAAGGPCVAQGAGARHPLLGVLPPSLAGPARVRATEGGAARGLTAHLPGVAVRPEALRDTNSPADLAAWRIGR